MPRLSLSYVAIFSVMLSTAVIDASPDVRAAPASKKSARKSQPVPPVRSAPDVTGTVQKSDTPKKPAPAADLDKDDGPVPAPFNLPTASRARMRACSESWQEMKLAGSAADQTWRAFATKCLASKEAPGKTAPP